MEQTRMLTKLEGLERKTEEMGSYRNRERLGEGGRGEWENGMVTSVRTVCMEPGSNRWRMRR